MQSFLQDNFCSTLRRMNQNMCSYHKTCTKMPLSSLNMFLLSKQFRKLILIDCSSLPDKQMDLRCLCRNSTQQGNHNNKIGRSWVGMYHQDMLSLNLHSSHCSSREYLHLQRKNRQGSSNQRDMEFRNWILMDSSSLPDIHSKLY